MMQKPQIKSQKAYKTISETAEMLDLTVSTIRFWEKEFKEIKPILINTRRHYSQENIELIKTIKNLLYEKQYTLNGAKKYLIDSKSSKIVSEQKNQDFRIKIKKIINLLQEARLQLEK